jgi:hypothetical protein
VAAHLPWLSGITLTALTSLVVVGRIVVVLVTLVVLIIVALLTITFGSVVSRSCERRYLTGSGGSILVVVVGLATFGVMASGLVVMASGYIRVLRIIVGLVVIILLLVRWLLTVVVVAILVMASSGRLLVRRLLGIARHDERRFRSLSKAELHVSRVVSRVQRREFVEQRTAFRRGRTKKSSGTYLKQDALR